MRRFAPFGFTSILTTFMTLACTVTAVRAESGPSYWAGNVSLSQPAVLPDMDDAEAAPMPRPSTAMPMTGTSHRVHQASYIEPIASPVTNQARQALGFYGGNSARATLNQMPRRTPIQPATSGQMPHSGKPFQTASSGTTVSPYLNLFRDDDDGDSESAPSYFAFVRPQMEQQEATARQQRDLQRLERQVQRGPAGGGAQYQSSGGPARYMDTAQFYGGWRK